MVKYPEMNLTKSIPDLLDWPKNFWGSSIISY